MDYRKKNKKHTNIPDGYFQDFQDRLFEKLEKDTSFLPSDDGFTVPKGYFNTLEERILEETIERKSKVISLFSKREYYYVAAVAAILLLLFNIGVFDRSVDSFDTLADSDIEAYVQLQSEDISAFDIAAAFDDVDLNDIEITNQSLDEDAMIDYLSENINSYDDIQINN